MPWKLNWSTDSISVSANFSRGMTTFLWGILKTIHFVFEALSDILLTIINNSVPILTPGENLTKARIRWSIVEKIYILFSVREITFEKIQSRVVNGIVA